MRRVYKYPLADVARIPGTVTVPLPRGARILTIQLQHGAPHMWVLVDPAQPLVDRTFIVYGTGWDIQSADDEYVGTYQQDGGVFVWHLFEVPR